MPRDDFSSKVKDELALRAGLHCSRPDCRAPTAGPSESRASGVSNVGVAAHICAAAEGGTRYDPGQTPEERASRENGIWLCSTDAKAIDDEERYDRSLLIAWREAAEALAYSEKGRPDAHASDPRRRLVPYVRDLRSSGEVSGEILDFLQDVGATRAWGTRWELARLILTELGLNAVEHGGGDDVRIEAFDHAVRLSDGGRPFGKADLRAGGSGESGGLLALEDFERLTKGSFTLRYRRADDRNEWTVVDEVATFGVNLPCSVSVTTPDRRISVEGVEEILESLDGCEELHVYHAPEAAYSWWIRFLSVLRERSGGRPLVVHGLDAEHPVAQMIARMVPDTSFPD